MKYGFFLPKSEETSYEPSAHCMFCSVKYSNQQARSQLGTPGGKKSFLRGPQIF